MKEPSLMSSEGEQDNFDTPKDELQAVYDPTISTINPVYQNSSESFI